MIFKEYCESFLQFVKIYFSFYEDLLFDKIKFVVKDKIGLDIWREIFIFFLDQFKFYSGIYFRGKGNVIFILEFLDFVFKYYMISFKVDFKEFMVNKLKRFKVFFVIVQQ